MQKFAKPTYFLLQVDITLDFVGQLDFNMTRMFVDKVAWRTNDHYLKNTRRRYWIKHNNKANEWKLEYSLIERGIQRLRIKFYNKTEELLTSCGVAQN